jgi:predicted nucleic acid-binding protein
MIVVDASVVLEILLRTPGAARAEERVLADESAHAPPPAGRRGRSRTAPL